jgi:carbonic anhydrase
MCELNVIKQVENLSHNTIVQKAWNHKRKLYIHGWIYSVSDGLIKDLKITQKGAPFRTPQHAAKPKG